MTSQHNRQDYAQRAARARDLANTATDPELAQVYLRTAENYAELARTAGESDAPSPSAA
jgi:hypothetical protein